MSHTAEHGPLGHCPECGTTIPPENLLIRYERGGETARYATCPDCGDPVRPSE